MAGPVAAVSVGQAPLCRCRGRSRGHSTRPLAASPARPRSRRWSGKCWGQICLRIETVTRPCHPRCGWCLHWSRFCWSRFRWWFIMPRMALHRLRCPCLCSPRGGQPRKHHLPLMPMPGSVCERMIRAWLHHGCIQVDLRLVGSGWAISTLESLLTASWKRHYRWTARRRVDVALLFRAPWPLVLLSLLAALQQYSPFLQAVGALGCSAHSRRRAPSGSSFMLLAECLC